MIQDLYARMDKMVVLVNVQIGDENSGCGRLRPWLQVVPPLRERELVAPANGYLTLKYGKTTSASGSRPSMDED